MIKLGSKEVTKIMKGSQEISSAYKGSDKVWSSAAKTYSTNAITGYAGNRIIEVHGMPNVGAVTFETWFRIEESFPNQGLYSGVMGHINSSLNWAVMFNAGSPASGNRTLQLMDMYHSDTYEFKRFTSSFPLTKWVHICLMASGSSIYGFLDGKQCFTGSTSHYYGYLAGKSVQMPGGCSHRDTAYGRYFDSRISNNLRYSTSSSGFTPPTAPFEPDNNTLSLTNRGDEFIDYSSIGIVRRVGTSLSHDAATPFV